MGINTKEAIDFGEKRLKVGDRGIEEPRAWVDARNAMMLKTDRSELINVLKNYEEFPIKRYDGMIESAKETETVKGTFGIDYMKDILKLMTKLKKDAETITIELGNDTCVILKLNDSFGVVLEVMLAPRIED